MNKWLVSMSAAAVAAGAMAVESANTVGVIEKSLDLDNDEFMMNLGACFVNMDTQSGGYVISNKIFASDAVKNDKLYVFDGDEWDLSIYEYRGAGLGWSLDAADGTSSNIQSFEVPTGAHVIYEPKNEDATVNIAGQVAASGTATVSFEVTDEDWIFELVNPYPIETTLGDLAAFCGKGDKIYTFDPEEWDLSIYEYRGTGLGWSLDAADGSSSNITDPDFVILAVGDGAYFEPKASREWTVTFNY